MEFEWGYQLKIYANELISLKFLKKSGCLMKDSMIQNKGKFLKKIVYELMQLLFV